MGGLTNNSNSQSKTHSARCSDPLGAANSQGGVKSVGASLPFIPDSGITVNIRWGHLDQMPRCAVKGCGKAICSHTDAEFSGLAGSDHAPFHALNTTPGER